MLARLWGRCRCLQKGSWTDGGKNQVGVLDMVKNGHIYVQKSRPRSECGPPGLSWPSWRRSRKVGQFQHLDTFRKTEHLLQPKGQYKSQIPHDKFPYEHRGLYDSNHLDPVLIGPHVNKEEVIEDNSQRYHGDQQFKWSSETDVGKPEALFQFISERRFLTHWVVIHGCSFLHKTSDGL